MAVSHGSGTTKVGTAVSSNQCGLCDHNCEGVNGKIFIKAANVSITGPFIGCRSQRDLLKIWADLNFSAAPADASA
jgi:hypothetical protein